MAATFVPPTTLTHTTLLPSPTATPHPSTCTHPLRPPPPPPTHKPNHRPAITMRKGPYQPPGMRRRPPQQPPQTKLPEDGTPVFSIFIRTPRQKIWYPLGAVKGDDRSKSLVSALKGGIAKGMYEKALDRGIAQTLYGQQNARFLESAFRAYPQLKKYAKELEFGYRVAAVGLDEQPTKAVSKDMALAMIPAIQKAVGSWFKNLQGQGDNTSK